MENKRKYLSIVEHYEKCFDKYGDTHCGVDWPKEEDVVTRHKVMLDLINLDRNRPEAPSLLDFGCGLGHFNDFLLKQKEKIQYSGLDISQKFIGHCKEKYNSNTFYCEDVLSDSSHIPMFDYIIMNGVFTEKRELSNDEMTSYMFRILSTLFNKCAHGMAFNVMSKLVEWEREDLFHIPFNVITDYLYKNLTRNFVIRHDYGLYEYTVYLYKNPTIAIIV
jgi:SAM-dependent methyltransferase